MRHASAWIATFAFIVNAYWCVVFGLKDLKIGYFLWWLSFLLVALGLFALSPQTTDNASMPSAKPKVPVVGLDPLADSTYQTCGARH